MLAALQKNLSIFLNRNVNASSDLALIFSSAGCNIMHELSNLLRHFLIDGLLTNQITLLLSVRGQTEFEKNVWD